MIFSPSSRPGRVAAGDARGGSEGGEEREPTAADNDLGATPMLEEIETFICVGVGE